MYPLLTYPVFSNTEIISPLDFFDSKKENACVPLVFFGTVGTGVSLFEPFSITPYNSNSIKHFSNGDNRITWLCHVDSGLEIALSENTTHNTSVSDQNMQENDPSVTQFITLGTILL